MFKISPITDPKIHMEYTRALSIPYRDGYFAYAMNDVETGELMGLSQFEIEGEGGLISDIAEPDGHDDFEAMFILGRQTMNFMDKCGATRLRALKTEKNERLLLAIGFRPDGNGNLVCKTDGMFDGHCDGHKVEL